MTVLTILSIICIWLSGYAIGRYVGAKQELRKLEKIDKRFNDLITKLRCYRAMGG